MQRRWKFTMVLSALLLLLQTVLWSDTRSTVVAADDAPRTYTVELDVWGISNNGTKAAETTQGINNALIWAQEQGYSIVKLPEGTYLIDRNSRINMVSNIQFELGPDTILQKEKNDKENYQVLHIGYGVYNVVLRGGVYRGDKDVHDYSKRDHPHSWGTHESGHGILIEGGRNITIDGISAVNFTGDGLVLGGYGTMVRDYYENSFVAGSIDSNGTLISDSKKVRSASPIRLDHRIFQTENTFELSNIRNLPQSFTLYFYRNDGSFIRQMSAKHRDIILIPTGADYFHVVFDIEKTAAIGAYFELWNRAVTQNVVVQNSEFAFNRRQGITVGGADNVLIADNVIHDIRGVAPQSGIDLEGGFDINGFRNTNITIRNNRFYNNAAYDVILFDGWNALVESNHLASKGAIGVAVSKPFNGARIVNNHFDGTRIVAINNAHFSGNRMNDSYTYFSGPNIRIDGMELTNSKFSISAEVPYGVSVSNVKVNNTNRTDTGLSVWGQPIKLSNVTVVGEPSLRAVQGGGAGGSTFENLTVVGYNIPQGLDLPPGTYKGCSFDGMDSTTSGYAKVKLAGDYVFDQCQFRYTTLYVEHPEANVTVRNSTFEVGGDLPAISVQAANQVVIDRNEVTADHYSRTSSILIKINDYWQRTSPYDVRAVSITGNTVRSNIEAVGISTAHAGIGAPAYTIADNVLHKAKLDLKANDITQNNETN